MESGTNTLSDQQKEELARLGVTLCYLHGSVASGIARPDSDLDVAVLFEQKPADSIQSTTDVIAALQGFAPDRKKDVAILNETSPLLRQIVASTGVLLYQRSFDDRLRFSMRTIKEYEYSKHIVKLGQDIVIQRALS